MKNQITLIVMIVAVMSSVGHAAGRNGIYGMKNGFADVKGGGAWRSGVSITDNAIEKETQGSNGYGLLNGQNGAGHYNPQIARKGRGHGHAGGPQGKNGSGGPKGKNGAGGPKGKNGKGRGHGGGSKGQNGTGHVRPMA